MNLRGLRVKCGLVMLLWLMAAPCSAQVQAQAQVQVQVQAQAQAASAAQGALEAREQALREQLATLADGPQRYRLINDLADAYFRAGRVAEALRLGDAIVQDERIAAGRRSLRASALALSSALAGDFARSERYISRAKALARETRPQELEELPDEPAYAFLSAEAEIARRAHNRHDVALAKSREKSELAWANFNEPNGSDKRHAAAANAMLNNVNLHVRLLVQNNRREEALSYAREMRGRVARRADLKAGLAQTASVGEAWAIALTAQDDYNAALAAIGEAIATFVRAKVAEHDVGYSIALRTRLMIALALGRIGEFAPDADAMLRGRAVNPVLAGTLVIEEVDTLALASRGSWATAAERIGQAMERTARAQGTDSPFYKNQAAMQILFKLSDPSRSVSPAEIARYVAGLASDEGDGIDAGYRGGYLEVGALAACLNALMPAGAAPVSADALALAFRISELLRAGASQGALADGAARLAASDPKLRTLIEQEQQLRFEQNSGRRAFASAADQNDRLARQPQADELVAQRRVAALAVKERELQNASGSLTALRRQIAAQFPLYRELISPSIPSAARIGAVLRPGEAYANFYAGPAAGFAFVVQPGGRLTGVRLEITRAQTTGLVATLRKPFDGGQMPTAAGELAGFDLAASHALFKAWLAPLQGQLQGAGTVYLSAGGVLSSLPWNVLVTQPSSTLADAAWWVKAVTPVQMPSASSLVLARQQRGRRAGSPFVAFADPSFDGRDTAASALAGTRSARQRAVVATRAAQDVDYRELTRLPETLDEARAIGGSLKADAEQVIHGLQATRSRVLKENLADTRVLAFATHGLLPGELPGMLKAGLALAYEGRGLQDSVLTIDDIVGLRLNADWVILSACNTGLASGVAGDSMSALARGFFAAGARTVLATQWAVESQSAKELTVGLFKALADKPEASKADALAAAQRDMLGGAHGALYRHPYFWAPYFISGDAAR